jgi:2,3-bisphosphoglycerate-dependent phosphoglycerate mutase
MRLLLIRHAQSANNALPETQRVEDPPITELGHRQAQALAAWISDIKLQRLITSPFRRSLQTTNYLQRQIGLPTEVWVDLHEQGGCYAGYEAGRYEGRPGMNRGQILQEFPEFQVEKELSDNGWWSCRPYETEDEARARARRLLSRAAATLARRGESAALVMHADFKRILLEELFRNGDDSAGTDWGGIFNTAVTAIEFRDTSPRLDVFNSIRHLPKELLSR